MIVPIAERKGKPLENYEVTKQIILQEREIEKARENVLVERRTSQERNSKDDNSWLGNSIGMFLYIPQGQEERNWARKTSPK